jgi:acetone carboxylase gamma subunit
MKKITILLLFAFVATACDNRERKCSDFKTGTFTFEKEWKGKLNKSIFIRTKDIQIETFNGKTDTATIRWVNDCEFVLQKLHPKTMDEKKAVSMKILSTSKNSYTFEYGFVGQGEKQRGTVTKIK